METASPIVAAPARAEAVISPAPAAPAPAAGMVSPPANQPETPATPPGLPGNRRVLIVDDNLAIHDDFRKILAVGITPRRNLLEVEAALFGGGPALARPSPFELDSAHQGQEALEKVKQACAAGKPYALAFVDMRMPPGWDGLETIIHLWQVDPDLQVVLCTAYSDYSWEEMSARLGETNSLVVLKKPFDNIEVLQLAHAFTRKWDLNRQANLKLGDLTQMVALRTRELEAANDEIKRESEERIELERQFRQAQKMEAIGQLAAGVAHDFNNILTVIHGHASMLSMRLGPEGPHTKSITEIRHSAERAANLVRQLLTFSRKQILQFRDVELGEVVVSVSGMLRELVGEHIAMETDCAVGLPPVHADRGMMEQVILNLAVNARDAMERGGRLLIQTSRVNVSLEAASAQPDARPGSFVCLAVSDTGCGIPPEAMSHLFEPFFTTKEVGKGTGLGLATVYGIIKQHQAWIQVESQVGVGSTFRVYFPASAHPSGRTDDESEGAPSRSGTETILIAEDETPLREMVSDILNLHGYRVIRANSGPAALAICKTDQPKIDLLLTDMVMPGGMMGTDLATELQKTNPALKIIYTTGYSPGSTGLKDALHPGVEFLPKPYSPHKLAELVRKSLDRKPD